jgi:hypothetical protein
MKGKVRTRKSQAERKIKKIERGFVHRRASGPTRHVSSPSTTADEKGGDPVPNRDETRIKYSNPARVHAMLKNESQYLPTTSSTSSEVKA